MDGTPPSASGAGPAHGFSGRGERLVLLLDMAPQPRRPSLVMGNGTNLLAPDEKGDRL